ncbi:MAG: UDP-N-acetylglucosamine 2-epimerase (non-hydrolyzing) [Legionellales bacterium]|nr:UDP-N-acetylglucosamine 2-epimerase (non-hydrolyzing) [Legionellales bacterium]OUX66210.1 MAG: UDP-N-acetylglucosamine 2-epimerase (non-hydrolyzing) [Gammaproteobacteria bacterium TMED281]|tara:strand:+ start:940 stop:2094 length:1155 start_codon:yes stop_codon:yes gene_type:complete
MNDKKKILVIFGTRPEAIKMAPVVLGLKKTSSFQTLVCVTGQHREMLDQVLTLFRLVPDYDLNLMKSDQTLIDSFAAIMTALKHVFLFEKPDMILVHGDTATTFASSLVAYFFKIPIGHVEAGLRTGNMRSPWPEEGNRKLTGVLADIHFAPTFAAQANLLAEGTDPGIIHITGNTVIDALLYVLDKDSSKMNTIFKTLQNSIGLNFEKKYVLITSHRRENHGDGLKNICSAIIQLSRQFKHYQFVFPVHLNPNVRNIVYKNLNRLKNVCLFDPVDYRTMIHLMANCELILTDSGGIQEEAPTLGKPVLVMRDTSERPEAVQAGTAKLVGTEVGSIVSTVAQLLTNKILYNEMATVKNPYGDGKAVHKIIIALRNYWQEKDRRK